MMTRKRLVTGMLLFAFALSFLQLTAATACAKDKAFAAVSAHLKTRYQAKQRRIPFLGLAGFAVKLARPAGVKSFKLMVFENLQLTDAANGGAELNSVLRNALGEGWQPLVRVYSKASNQQTYVYATSEGKTVKLMIVALEQAQATVVRVKLNPDALVKFMDNPKILGISLASD
ncbi:MAG: hypothetical protein ABR577_14645 [Pyrinomonadaceae bacterium]